uniref:Methionine aminopeptidase n=1 Tax=Arion vulgaris TaxID=1028688 RepID=A0A0B6ZZ46_9EUPU
MASAANFQRKIITIMYSCPFTRLLSTTPQTMTRKPFNKSVKCKYLYNVPETIPVPSYVSTGVVNAPKYAEIKTDEQVKMMRPACQLAASILRVVGENIKPGITTEEINSLVHSKCIEAGAYPSPLKYKGYPKSVCTSVNHVACHGIPGHLELQLGDIINVDITVFYKGYHGDTSETFTVGIVDERTKDLVETARLCRDVGISVCKNGALFSDIGDIIYFTADRAGFEVIPYFCGHGIGEYFHGPPDIVHVPSDSVGNQHMVSGMTFTIEPILCDGSPEIKILDDDWTVVTVDGSKSAQFEHTILVTDEGCEILTI